MHTLLTAMTHNIEVIIVVIMHPCFRDCHRLLSG